MTDAGETETLDAAAGDAPYANDWSLRPWLLAGLLAIAGLLIHLLTDGAGSETPLRVALATFTFFTAIGAAFTLDEDDLVAPAIFALVIGLVMAGLSYHAVDQGDRVADEEYAVAAGVFFSLLALPLFQAGFHRLRFRTDYKATHWHVWSDAITAAGALAFTGLSWLVLYLLASLFDLIGIDFLELLTREGWFGWMFSGAAFGAALGVLRNQLSIIGTLQGVVMLVLSLLAVPFALAMIAFSAAFLLSGGQALWDATDSATPLLLACAVGSFVLANAVIRDDDAARSSNAVMQASAVILSLAIFPLSVFAAISMGIRVDQHGLAPERIWALVAIAVATAYGLAYWVGIARGRMAGWSGQLRGANFNLAVGASALALFLALPILNFGSIATANQISRLQSGAVSVEEFDFTALRWDFGAAGRRGLERLKAEGGEIATLAQEALDQDERPWGRLRNRRAAEDIDLRMQPENPQLRAKVIERVRYNRWQCEEFCVGLDLGVGEDGKQRVAVISGSNYEIMRFDPSGDAEIEAELAVEETAIEVEGGARGGSVTRDSTVEIRDVQKRYIFVDGKPLGRPLPD
ncbi:DUF4153 domain-containing protein [Paraurantiacibacter namhicola]|uniref:DUF4153 domain-containing protein n=1 Tax=Paraurantiacibacter namhicola TaxID=645517 RepID=A0A1C7DBD8_9SPHN|nr:DUF4153 domain-containing protein [Paraurantiacibacter namhicola]ANU08621.1 hypothetical protein A6F65_02338 [Paraurantiacibacter namhicola]